MSPHDLDVDQQHAVYAEKRSKLLKLLENTKSLLDDIRTWHNDTLALRYPLALTSFKENGTSTNGLMLSASDLSILKLDIPAADRVSLASRSQLDDTFTPSLIKAKINEATNHLERLHARITDIRSRVLVTGDLNAGKSTFVNAIMRREIVPDDQQPCTALFCEVIDADQNDGVEEVHGISDMMSYKRTDPSTYSKLDIADLRGIVEENELGYNILKVYARDARPKEESLLHNGVVDLSLIDSPGLNIDSMKTTALFAQQEEIDVIVFVVNAENHFTLSGRQFLETAGKEKSYIFIVVNRFDQIRRKDRCKRDILEQIKEISPMTYANVDHLVHFVAARHTLIQDPDPQYVADFKLLEEDLRSFVLEKRSKSKLAPAQVYLTNLLSDISALCNYNYSLADMLSNKIAQELSVEAPAFERMLRIKEDVLDHIDNTIEKTAVQVHEFAEQNLTVFVDAIEALSDDIEWNGVIGMWQYARDLRNTIYRLAAMRLRRCEDHAKQNALACVKAIEDMASQCMSEAPAVNTDVIQGVFEDGSAEAGRAAAATMFIPMELGDFFDWSDKLAVFREYLLGFGLTIGGLLGYQTMAIQGWRGGVYVLRGKAAFAGLTMAGVGLVLYTLSDMKSVLDRQVVGKMRNHLIQAGLVDANTDRITRGVRRVLRLSIWEFQTQFQRILSENQTKRQVQTESRRNAELAKEAYRTVASRADTLRRMVQEIDL